MDQFVFDAHDEDIMGRTIWGEARGESAEGQVAVAWVIRNRATRARFAQYLAGKEGAVARVCTAPWQFSCWNENDPNRKKLLTLPRYDGQEPSQFRIAHLVCAGVISDPTNGADHYYVTDMANPPFWKDMFKITAVIGAHTFLDSRIEVQSAG